MGQIVTFYSYRGGVGRTMALAYTASILAEWGYKTLVIDWDLEAPGLESYFKKYIDLEKEVTQQGGIIDLLHASGGNRPYTFREAEEASNGHAQNGNGAARGNGKAKSPPSWRDFIVRVGLIDGQGNLDMLTAGRRDARYFEKVRRFDVQKFYRRRGGHLIEEWRKQWKEAYDFVLIDCRAGVTDIGAICTVQLPDILFLMLTAAERGLDQSVAVARSVTAARADLPLDRFRLLTVPIISRYDDERVTDEVRREWWKRVEDKVSVFYDDWLPTDFRKTEMLALTKIPYYRSRSLDEHLSVMHWRGEIGYAFENLSALIANRLDNLHELRTNRTAYIIRANKALIARSARTPPSPQETRKQHELWLSSDGKKGMQGDFSKRKLHAVNFSKAILKEAIFIDADLSDAVLSGADLSGADLTDAVLSGANLNGADLTSAILSRASLRKATGIDAKLINTDLNKTDLSNSSFIRADFRQARLEEVKLVGADLSYSQFVEADFLKVDFRDARMLNANLSSATITNPINLTSPQFGGTNLSGAKLPEDISEDITEGEELRSAQRHATRLQWYFFGVLAASIYILLVAISLTADALLLTKGNLPAAAGRLPARGFVLMSPAIVLVLYLLLHFSLFKLRARLTKLPGTLPGGIMSVEKITNGYVRAVLQLPGDTQPPLRPVLFGFFARWLIPTTLFIIWARYLPLRDRAGTLVHTLVLATSVLAAIFLSRWRSKATDGETGQP